MKRFKGLKWTLFLLMTVPGFSHARMNNFGSDSGCLLISTTPTSPTLVFSPNSNVRHTVVVNPSTYTVSVAALSGTISTNTSTGNFYIPASSSWSPDGPLDFYVGGLYAVVGSGAPSTQAICVQRSY